MATVAELEEAKPKNRMRLTWDDGDDLDPLRLYIDDDEDDEDGPERILKVRFSEDTVMIERSFDDDIDHGGGKGKGGDAGYAVVS
eukprot:CAMPEP_0116030838 /NCGR_PEP_ID=MMETSP0321-20121206/17112_1 /TAXON_ID=163516 /ORGANISM="Leptocylindrus danicus var. danicus, Strain B650" /LENGTH=84 /DNA_ID=CAMNT_0003505759 /DNA_START=167 /DNA_END=421 /DNA_ORIENTATION=+